MTSAGWERNHRRVHCAASSTAIWWWWRSSSSERKCWQCSALLLRPQRHFLCMHNEIPSPSSSSSTPAHISRFLTSLTFSTIAMHCLSTSTFLPILLDCATSLAPHIQDKLETPRADTPWRLFLFGSHILSPGCFLSSLFLDKSSTFLWA